MRSNACRVLVLALLLSGGCGEQTSSPVPTGALRLGAVLGEADDGTFARAEAPRTFRFPEDHGPHPEFRSEWWYLTAVLEDEDAQPLGLQFTLFRQALTGSRTPEGEQTPRPANRWQTPQVYLAHFAVTDTATGTHESGERFARGHPSLAGVTVDPFRLWLEDWQIEAQDPTTWHLAVDDGERAASLELRLTGPIVLQGEGGLSRKGEGQASYYYSLPFIEASGRVRVDGAERQVRGTAWLDREWSTSMLSDGQLGWDWFALSLDDGRRVMLFRLRRADGTRDPFDQGMLAAPGKADRALTAADFDLQPVRGWRDEDGAEWPVGWSVRVGEETWSVEAVMDDQRMNTSIRYWEGLVTVRDGTGERIGRGYLELTGYDRAASTEIADTGLGGTER
ncbi:MAG: lipocalin-like domain-containing protein [Pseudomonadales bacterium]